MKFLDLLSLVLDNLGRRKGRVALTAVGVVIGTAAIVVLVSLAVGLQRNATNQLYGISDLSRIEVYPGYNEMPVDKISAGGGGGGTSPSGPGTPGQMVMLTTANIEKIKEIPHVKQVIINDSLQTGFMMKFGGLEGYGNITGVDVNDVGVFEYPMASGETKLEKGTAVIGSWVPRNFYDPKARPGQAPPDPPDLTGQQVKIILMKWTQDGQEIRKTITLKVVGTFAETRSIADSSIYVRLEDVTAWNEWARGTRINRNKEGYNMIVVRADEVENVLDIAAAINEMGFMANTPQSVVEGINSFFTVLQVIFGGIGAISLLVAAIGIANTMAMAILERTREIGLMKAIGATNRDVLSIFLGEAAGIGFVGGVGGVALGWVSSQIINAVAGTYLSGQMAGGMTSMLATYTPPWLPLFALIFATLVGLLSGLYPALRAATLIPVNALKYE